MRTIVFSDVHGEPSIIRGVVEHSGYRPGSDRLIFAGDAIEVGSDSWGCLELLDELDIEFLVGNHEYAAWEGCPIELDSLNRLDVRVQSVVTRHIDAGDWMLAAHADGVLITHAGVGNGFAADLESAGGDVGLLADALNAEFAGAVAMGPGVAVEGVIQEDGPLWFRPGSRPPPLSGVAQVAGHTPPEIMRCHDPARAWAARGLYLIDPFVRRWLARLRYGAPVPVRYAVIEDGEVSVIEDGFAE